MFQFLYFALLSSYQAVVDFFLRTISKSHHRQLQTAPSSSEKMKNIIILGGSYAGVSTAHRILKQAAGKTTTTFKITLISPNTHFYWNIAAPRGLTGQFSDETLFRPIAPGFEQYTPSQFEFIVASAENLDVKGKKVEITSSAGNRMLDYDFLILATGTHIKSGLPFKGLGSTETTKTALHEYQAKVQKAKTIVVGGAGVTGIEISGELGFEYGRQKRIILIASGPTVLHEAPPSVSQLTLNELRNLQVEVKVQTKITRSKPISDGKQELTLSNGQTLITDMYIPTFGLVPNTSYVPTQFLNASGYVIVDEYLKVKGAKDIWAIGDVSDVEWSQFISCDRQSIYAAKNIVATLSNKIPQPYKAVKSRFMGFSIGKKAGTGHYGTWKLPSFVIVRVRKNLFTDWMQPMIDGSRF